MPKQNPFSLYDFLGYFVPGAIVVYGVLLIYGGSRPDGKVLFYIENYLSTDNGAMYIPFVILSYVAGHFLSFLSSVTVEKYSLWTVGYPSKYLLRLGCSKFFDAQEPKILWIAIKLVVSVIILFPIASLDMLLGRWLGMRVLYSKPLDDLLFVLVSKKIVKLLEKQGGMGIDELNRLGQPVNHDFFRFAYHYALENAPNHFEKMQNYVALYGFLRTLAFIAVMFFWWMVVCMQWSWDFLGIMILNMCVSYVFFMAFVKFYRRFTLEALMAMSVSVDGSL